MTVIRESDSPGNEQRGFWTCAAASMEGGDNLMGVCDPVVDALVPLVVGRARPRCTAGRDACARPGAAVGLVPGAELAPAAVRVAYWDRFGRPDEPVRPGVVFDSWWIDPAKIRRPRGRRARAGN